jgi:hypothetical protein
MAANLGELRGEAAHRSRRGRYPNDVAFAKARDLEQPRVGGEAHPAERSQVAPRWREIGIEPGERAQPAQRRAARRHDGVVAPSERVPHGVAGSEPLGPRSDDLPTVMMPSIAALSGNAAK